MTPTILDGEPVTAAVLFDRYFATTKKYDAVALMILPPQQRPLVRVECASIYDLRAARTVEPAYCRVEYVIVAADNSKAHTKHE